MSRLPDSVRRVVCYVRKSREDEEAELRGEATLAKQRDMLVSEVLPRYNVEFDVAEELASGDSIARRPVFRRLLSQLGNTYQAIVCKDLSRLGRGSYGDMGVVYDLIRHRRIFIVTKDAVFDPGNFSDLRMIRFSLFFHREEYEMTLWRLTEGKYDGAARGKWVAGSVPYGYLYDSKTQTLTPHPTEAAVVRLIYQWHTNEGVGYRAIASKLSQLGYHSPRGKPTWHPEVIRRILKNPAYKGTLEFRKTQRDPLTGRTTQRPLAEHIVVEQAFPALVENRAWDEAQALGDSAGADALVGSCMKEDSGASGKGRVARMPRITRAIKELTGVVRCADCGRTLVRQCSDQTYEKRDGFTSVYHKEFLYCSTCNYAVKYRDCEGQIKRVLCTLPIDAAALREVMTRLDRTVPPELAVTLARQIDHQKSHIQARLESARRFLLDGVLSPEEYMEAKRECQQALERLDAFCVSGEKPTGALDNDDVGDHRGRGDLRGDSDGGDSDRSDGNAASRLADLRNVGDVYDCLASPASKNRLLKVVFTDVQLRRTAKGRGRHHPSRFDLYVTFAGACKGSQSE